MDAGLFGVKTKGGAGAVRGSTGPGSTVDRSSKLFIEAYLALQGLGYKDVQAKEMVEAAFKKNVSLAKVEDVIKNALQGNF